jgi:4,5-dihydroxyphthalate decarboxylase
MADLRLSFAMTPYDRIQPLISGEVKPDGITLEYQGMPGYVPGVFYDQVKFHRYDLSEFSFSEYLHARPEGMPYQMLPIFHNRSFSYTWIVVRSESGIRVDHPEDLRGKRFGTGDYHQTAALWTRGVLQHEFGVDPMDLEWWMERTEERSHGGHTGFTPPPGLRFHRVPADQSLATMLLSGELDASLLYLAETNLVDRSGVDLSGNPAIRNLFPNPAAEGVRYFQKTGIFPINHGVVVRRSLLEEHPWVAINIYKAFLEAKDRVNQRAKQLASVYFTLGLLPPEKRSAMDQDPYPYGITANRKVLETIAEYSHEQGLTPRVIGLDEVFAPSTLSL